MNDVRTAIVLAAGSSRRMGELTAEAPKSLLPYRGVPILLRLLAQIKHVGIERIVLVVGYQHQAIVAATAGLTGVALCIVHNARFAEDTNINSMRLALAEVDGAVVIFEADTIMEPSMVSYAAGSDFEGQSAWFTRGAFTPAMYGGIVDSDANGRLTDVRVVPAWLPQYANYRKMTGVMRVGANELPRFRELVGQYAKTSLAQYFFVPWAEHLGALPSVDAEAQHFRFGTFNTEAEYRALLAADFDPPAGNQAAITMASPHELCAIEDFDPKRADELVAKITAEQVWTKPLYIEKTHRLVLDGHHRLQAALRLGLRRVPVQEFSYDDVAVWTLRKAHPVDVTTVIRRARAGNLYPYKTVKHKFPAVIEACHVALADLT